MGSLSAATRPPLAQDGATTLDPPGGHLLDDHGGLPLILAGTSRMRSLLTYSWLGTEPGVGTPGPALDTAGHPSGNNHTPPVSARIVS